MHKFDRRDWLRMAGFLTGATIASRSLLAGPTQAAASGASRNRLIQLSLNENPFGPAPSVVAALRREFANLCRYTGSELSELRGLIAAKEGIPEGQIIMGEILEPLGTYLSLQGGPGGEFIYSDPGYTALIDSAVATGGHGVPVPLNAAMQNDLPAIASRVNRRTRAVYLVNPHNPTGTVNDAEELARFVREVSDRTLVIMDEAYLEFADFYTRRTLG
jgi:histidinol-phosphate aminotransferase